MRSQYNYLINPEKLEEHSKRFPDRNYAQYGAKPLEFDVEKEEFEGNYTEMSNKEEKEDKEDKKEDKGVKREKENKGDKQEKEDKKDRDNRDSRKSQAVLKEDKREDKKKEGE